MWGESVPKRKPNVWLVEVNSFFEFIPKLQPFFDSLGWTTETSIGVNDSGGQAFFLNAYSEKPHFEWGEKDGHKTRTRILSDETKLFALRINDDVINFVSGTFRNNDLPDRLSFMHITELSAALSVLPRVLKHVGVELPKKQP